MVYFVPLTYGYLKVKNIFLGVKNLHIYRLAVRGVVLPFSKKIIVWASNILLF
jgi:hypothetical protein